MKHIYSSYFILLFMALFVTGCVNDPDIEGGIRNAKKPEVKTHAITGSTANSVTLSGEVLAENGAPVTEAGFCWSTQQTFTLSDKNKKELAKRQVKFDAKIDGLVHNMKYYICAYAINQVDTAYGDVLPFTTKDGLGSIETLRPTNLMSTTVQCGGKIIMQGESEVTERGVYLMLSPEISPLDSIIPIPMKADSFYCTITNLKPQTQYYVRAYVKNKYGEYNGAKVEQFFTTDGLPDIDSFKKVGEANFTSVDFTMRVSDQGDNPVTACGFCFGLEPSPTIENSDTIICGSGLGTFVGRITKMEQQKKYYVRAYATNSIATRYSEGEGFYPVILKSDLPVVSTTKASHIKNGEALVGGMISSEGSSPIKEAGVCWSTNPNPTITSNEGKITTSETSTFAVTLKNLKGSTTYYVKAYAINGTGTQYGEEITFDTPDIFSALDKKFEGGFRVQGSVGYCTISDNIACVIGGDAGRNYSDEFWIYSSSLNKWTGLAALPKKLTWQSAFNTGLTVWIFGGREESGKASGNLYLYDSIRNLWQSIDKGTGWPDGFYSSAASTIGTSAYFVGGCRDTIMNDVWVLNIENYTWKKKKVFPVKQYGGISVVIGGRIYAGLGMTNMTGPSVSYGKSLWSTNANAESWEEEASFPGTGCLSGVAYNDCIYVIDSNSYIWKYDPAGKNWTRKSQLPAAYRTTHCMYVLNDKKIYIGLGNTSDTLVKYDPSWDN